MGSRRLGKLELTRSWWEDTRGVVRLQVMEVTVSARLCLAIEVVVGWVVEVNVGNIVLSEEVVEEVVVGIVVGEVKADVEGGGETGDFEEDGEDCQRRWWAATR